MTERTNMSYIPIWKEQPSQYKLNINEQRIDMMRISNDKQPIRVTLKGRVDDH